MILLRFNIINHMVKAKNRTSFLRNSRKPQSQHSQSSGVFQAGKYWPSGKMAH